MVDILAAWKVDLVFGMPGAHINALYPGKVITELERVHRRRTKVAFYPHTPLMIGD
jgi:thiamine pyrophosphate-dependent acetolactate synthase large subunit-like protein